MNSKIISEFEKLITFITFDDIQEHNDFRLRQLKNILSILKKYSKEITLDNYKELSDIKGIGKSSISRIKEILDVGYLSELKNFKEDKDKSKIIEELEKVIGIGSSKALDFYKMGIRSVKDLINKVNKGEIKVNDKLKLGLKYYGKCEGNIPRNEITNINKIFIDIFKKLNKGVDEDNKYIFEICGSYRRENKTSGDIDLLISKKGVFKSYLEDFIKILKNPLSKNNNKSLIIDDLTDKKYKTKYMGFVKYLDNPSRRLDVRCIEYDSYFSALVYFTGSMELNKKMRQQAKIMELKLSEYGLFKKDGTKLPVNSEKDIFDILKIDYLEPKFR
jgi:hypothetical protein